MPTTAVALMALQSASRSTTVQTSLIWLEAERLSEPECNDVALTSIRLRPTEHRPSTWTKRLATIVEQSERGATSWRRRWRCALPVRDIRETCFVSRDDRALIVDATAVVDHRVGAFSRPCPSWRWRLTHVPGRRIVAAISLCPTGRRLP